MTTQLRYGIRANLGQFLHQLLQVLLVGFAIGMTRTVVPALAESEFGLPRNSYALLATFIVAFGVVKAMLNFVAGRMSDYIGRKNVLLLGWVAALPIPVLIFFAPSWDWIVVATVLLGVNQGLTWSATQTAKLDITRPEQRGLTIGLNEFSGYVGLAAAGIITGYLATILGPRSGLLIFGMSVVVLALVLTVFAVKDTRAWVHADSAGIEGKEPALMPRYPNNIGTHPSTWEVFTLMSWRDRRLATLCQAGLIEKFVDALVWMLYPIYLYQQQVSLPDIGWIVGVYGFVWGVSQIYTGRLSDQVGRHKLNIGGMMICAVGVGMMVLHTGMGWWSASAAISGFGMALLYPNLSAAVADIAHPSWRSSAIGIYRFWRDLGYAVGAFGLGVVASLAGEMTAAFWFVALSMFLSAAVLWLWGAETHPKFAPAGA